MTEVTSSGSNVPDSVIDPELLAMSPTPVALANNDNEWEDEPEPEEEEPEDGGIDPKTGKKKKYMGHVFKVQSHETGPEQLQGSQGPARRSRRFGGDNGRGKRGP